MTRTVSTASSARPLSGKQRILIGAIGAVLPLVLNLLTVDLVTALRRQGVPFEQLIIPDEIHGFLRHASWVRAYKATADFFRRKL